MIKSFNKIINTLDDVVLDSLKKSPQKHISDAHIWATQKVKENTPDYMKL